jgi:hypothetical protein
METQQTVPQQSGLGKLISVGMVLLLPVIGLALLMPAVQSSRKAAMRSSLGYSERGENQISGTAADQAAKGSLPATPPTPRAVVKKYDAEIKLTPQLSVGTATPESIYVADFQATIEAQAPKDELGECQIELPLPPKIISLANVDFRVDGQPAEGFRLENDHLIWQGPLQGNQTAEIIVAYSATGKGVYTLEKPSGKIIEEFRTKLIADRSNIRMLELSLQPNSLERSPESTTYTWDYKRLVVARPIAIDVLGIAALDRLGELTWLGPMSVLMFGVLIGLIALAHDPEKLNVWLVILVAGCFAGAYPMMYFLQDFIELAAAVVLSTAAVLLVIAWRIVSLFGLRRGLFGGVVLPVVLMALTIGATLQSKPAMRGVLLTVMGIFALVTAMTLLPRAQANLIPPKQGS